MEIAWVLCTALMGLVVGVCIGREASNLTEEEMIRRIKKIRYEQRIEQETGALTEQELKNL